MAQRTEYAVKTIDAHGDVIDVDHFDGKREALMNADSVTLDGEVRAVIVERLVWQVKHGGDEADRDMDTCVFVRGDQSALDAGEWKVD